MDITELLASLLNPNGQQSLLGGPNASSAVGDHNNPAMLQQAQQRLAQPPQMQPQQRAMPPQAPQGQPMPQNSPQAVPGQQGGGLGGFLSNIINPQQAGKTRTVGWLQEQGLDPGTATVLASDKGALRTYMLQRANGAGPTQFDQRAQAAAQYGLDPSTPDGRDFILTGNLPQARGGNAELGLQPQYGVDEQGNPALLQLGKDGKVVKSQMPDGVTLSKTPIKLDAGTEWILLDPITRQPVGRIPKDIAGAAAQAKIGEAQGAAAFDLPRVEQNAQQTLDVIEQLKKHPGRAAGTGLSATLDPRNYLAGTDATNFKIALDQAKGQTFLQAFQMLKGAGAITDIEGAKATDAIARLNTSQSDEEFTRALTDFESVIRTSLARAQQQAGVPASSGKAPPGEAPPATYDGDPKLWKFMTPEQRKLWQ